MSLPTIAPTCKVLGCNESCIPLNEVQYGDHFTIHARGGMFRSGESFEQYSIIEADFINFIKNVPLVEAHFNVYSPILRDIIIRSCVQIEIFLKEWAKYFCGNDSSNTLYKEYHKNERGEKNWTIGSYIPLQRWFNWDKPIYVLPLGGSISPFENWNAKNPPAFWCAYNILKHNGHAKKEEAKLHHALYAVAGLFYLHCMQPHSKYYLQEIQSVHVGTTSNSIYAVSKDIQTPIDAKVYLFRANKTTAGDYVQIDNGKEKIYDRDKD